MEKTTFTNLMMSGSEKHLHGRGEDTLFSSLFSPLKETPPRTWRRLNGLLFSILRKGNTSTDVEKTRIGSERNGWGEKHLHGRGEDGPVHTDKFCDLETPPRTWRRPLLIRIRLLLMRNTSTDVEKTETGVTHRITIRKHLHGRGEDLYCRFCGCSV